ncbi:LOW QUALITY PROTEIN: hypothetical protein ACHAXS_005168 [Conticribra weissflogii]
MAASNISNSNAQDKNDAKNNKQKDTSPPKPYTKYTIYFRLERMRLLLESDLIDDEIKTTFQPDHFDYIEHPRPLKYKDVQMPPFWYSSFVKPEYIENRKHCKKEGRISFKELSQKISASWRSIDDETASYINKLAEFERVKYKKILEVFNTHQEAREINSCKTGDTNINLDLINQDSLMKTSTVAKRASIHSLLSPDGQIRISCDFGNLQEYTHEIAVEDCLTAHLMMNRIPNSDRDRKFFVSLEGHL